MSRVFLLLLQSILTIAKMHFHKRVQGLAFQIWPCRSRTERRAAVSVLVCGSTPLVISRKCGGGWAPHDTSHSAATLVLHRFPIQSRVIRTTRHPVMGSTVQVNCLQHSSSGNARRCTWLALFFELRRSDVQNHSFFMEMHPMSIIRESVLSYSRRA
jgi:hypothetical protein